MNEMDLITLYDYNYWANARVLDCAARVTPEQYAAPAGLSHGSLRGTLVHTFVAELTWRLRCQERLSPRSLPVEADYPSLELLRESWRVEENAMRLYIQSLNEDSLQEIIHYTTTKGVAHSNRLGHLLVHVVNHGTQTRAEAGLALASYGHSPGDLDMVLYFREREG
jgi:uncharacterized damage-inducible protein DinB